MRGLIDIEPKGYESIGCYTYYVAFSYDLDLGFSRWNFEKTLCHRNGRVDWHGKNGIWIDIMLDPCCDFELWPHQWPLPWIFKVKFWNCCISEMGGLTHMEWKGCELDMILDEQWGWPWATVHGIKISQIMDQCETSTVSILLAHEWAIRSLI